MSRLDCFGTLGLPIGASEDNIKQAYRRLAKTHHPDLGGNTDKFVRIQKAYETLMEGPSRSSSDSSYSGSQFKSNASRSGHYWSSWDTDGTWWAGKNSSHSSESDFDAEFNEQWNRFTREKRRGKRREFKAKNDLNEDESEDDFDSDPTLSKEDRYTREKQESAFHNTGRDKRDRQKEDNSKKQRLPDGIVLSCEKEFTSTVTGEYARVAKFNGRVCFANSDSNLFMFWSNKNKDWKISSILKDDGNCIAFNDRVHPSIDCPIPINEDVRWMVWSERARRYLPAKLRASQIELDYSSWTVDQLREALELRGLKEKAANCYEKSELVNLLKLFQHIKPKTEKFSSNDPIPEGHFRLCSRQRHDGVMQSPPVLNERCKVGNNRVDAYSGPLEGVEGWLLKHGDRRRFYGVYDSDKCFCFGLIWKNNKAWARAGIHDW